MPGPDALDQFLVDAGVLSKSVDDPTAEFSVYTGAAVEEFQRRSGWVPFDEVAPSNWYFDPPIDSPENVSKEVVLELGNGFTTISEVRTGVSASDDNGTLLTSGTDYDLLPYNAARYSRPFEAILFKVSPGTVNRSIKIVGTPGFQASIPDDVYQAVLERAAALALPRVQQAVGQATEVKQGPVTVKYATDEHQDRLSLWNDNFERTVMRYMRVTV